MSIPAAITPTFGIRIVCLPKGYDTNDAVKILVENIMCLGMVKDIHIQTRKIDNNNNNTQRDYTSAYVEFTEFNPMHHVIAYLISLPVGMTAKLLTNNYYYNFEWPNGQGNMTHLSLQKTDIRENRNTAAATITTTNPLELPAGTWTSLHIPVLTSKMILDGAPFIPTEHLQDFIENKVAIGKVRRIDFVEREDMYVDTNGAIHHRKPEEEEAETPETETEQTPILAAFIHMECWFDNKKAQKMRQNLDAYGQYHMRGYDELASHQFRGMNGNNAFFIFKINHKPIPDADGKLNIHQLSSMNAKLKEELANRDAEIENLKAQIQQQQVQVVAAAVAVVTDDDRDEEYDDSDAEKEHVLLCKMEVQTQKQMYREKRD